MKVLERLFGVPQINEKQQALASAEAKEAAESEVWEAKRREHSAALASFGKENEAMATAHAAAQVRPPQTAMAPCIYRLAVCCAPWVPECLSGACRVWALLKTGSGTHGGCCCLQAAEDVLQTILQRQEQLGTAINQLKAKQAEFLAKSEGHREGAKQVLLRRGCDRALGFVRVQTSVAHRICTAGAILDYQFIFPGDLQRRGNT